MERSFEDMDFLVRHFGAHRRRHPGPAQVATIGMLPGKRDRILHTFNSLNFSLLLQGCGDYVWKGRTHWLEAPMVFLQFPGEPMDYGPAPGNAWSEIYLVYPPDSAPLLGKAGFADPERPFWRIRDRAAVESIVEELTVVLRQPDPPADRADRICERLILESLLGSVSDAEDPALAAVEQIRMLVRRQPGLPHDFESLAARRGLSLSTFRRAWLDRVGLPPARWLRAIRMREACRLLVETRLPVGDIARTVGFDDNLYFSRRFHADRGVTPTAYRRTHKPHDLP